MPSVKLEMLCTSSFLSTLLWQTFLLIVTSSMAFAWEVAAREASSYWLRFVLLMQERHAAGESREAAVSTDVLKRHV